MAKVIIHYKKPLYVNGAVKDTAWLRMQIGRRALVNLYLLCLSEKKEEELVIYPAVELKQKLRPQNTYYVIGVARGYPEALELVSTITAEVVKKTKETHISQYFFSKSFSKNK